MAIIGGRQQHLGVGREDDRPDGHGVALYGVDQLAGGGVEHVDEPVYGARGDVFTCEE